MSSLSAAPDICLPKAKLTITPGPGQSELARNESFMKTWLAFEHDDELPDIYRHFPIAIEKYLTGQITQSTCNFDYRKLDWVTKEPGDWCQHRMWHCDVVAQTPYKKSGDFCKMTMVKNTKEPSLKPKEHKQEVLRLMRIDDILSIRKEYAEVKKAMVEAKNKVKDGDGLTKSNARGLKQGKSTDGKQAKSGCTQQ